MRALNTQVHTANDKEKLIVGVLLFSLSLSLSLSRFLIQFI